MMSGASAARRLPATKGCTVQYRYCCGDEDMSFDLIPEPQSVTLNGEAADSDDAGAPVPVALPLVGRISEDRDIDDIAGVSRPSLPMISKRRRACAGTSPAMSWWPDCPRQCRDCAPGSATRFMLEVVHHIETRPSSLEPQEYRLTIARSGIGRRRRRYGRRAQRRADPSPDHPSVRAGAASTRHRGQAAYKVRGYYLDATRGRSPRSTG